MMRAPWTDIGHLQSDIESLKNQLNRKANDYDVSEARRLVGSLEHTVGQIRTEVDGFRYRIEELEARELERQQQSFEQSPPAA